MTHRAYDLGALLMARELSASLGAPLVMSMVTRLLVDLNRSIGHPHLHREAVRNAQEREQIIADHYLPYRMQVENLLKKAMARGLRTIHISSHSFTPRLNGKVRTADVGLLYDPSRPGEARICARWKVALLRAAPDIRVRRNYPYLGKNDGFTTYLRHRYRPAAYIGVEVEINQAIVTGARGRWVELRAAIIGSLRVALASS